VFLCFSNKCEYLRVEIVVSHSPKEVSNYQVFSGFDSHLRSFFEHHKANDAPKNRAVFEENDVNVCAVFYIFWLAFFRPIDLDVLSARVYPPLH
tara:strand:+ start:150 stop:431 length:282 start_codon:yes stop_codon:yes gene_type:complete